MPHQHLIAYIKNNEIFNKYFKEEISQLYEKFGTIENNNLFTYKSYRIPNTYRQDEYYIAEIKEPLEYQKLENLPETPRVFKYSRELTYFSGKVFQTEDYVNTVDIIKHIYNLDESIGKKMIDTYHAMCANSKDVLQFGKSIFMIQKVLYQYLKENSYYETAVNIDYDPKDGQSVNQWFKSLEVRDYYKFPRYNDSDYTQFLFCDKKGKEYYIIEDVSADKLFIYKSLNENSGTWYMTSRNDFNVDDDMHDALYSSRQYIAKNIEENLNDFTLIGQYDNGKVVKATTRLDDLNLVQGYIYGELYKENKVKLDIEDSFAYMLSNYRKDHDYYNHDFDEGHFLSYLEEIKENPGSLYYHNYQYHENHDNNPKLEYLEDKLLHSTSGSKDYNHLRQLPTIYQDQIMQYIKEKMEKFSNKDSVKAHLNAIKNALCTEDENNERINKDDKDMILIDSSSKKEIIEAAQEYSEVTGKLEKIQIRILKF